MKNKTCLLAVGILAALAPLRAADVQAHWNELCRVAAGHQLNVTAADGKVIRGTCVFTDPDELSLNGSQQQVLKIARSDVKRVDIRVPGSRRHLADLGASMGFLFEASSAMITSPYAPVGLAVIPVTIAWGAAAAPICLLLDIGSIGATTQNITLID